MKQKRNFIEIVFLGSERACYFLALASLIQAAINFVAGEIELVGICSICAVVFIITGFIIRLLSKKVTKCLNEIHSFGKEYKIVKTYSFISNMNNQKRNFITNVREMPTNKKNYLSYESIT